MGNTDQLFESLFKRSLSSNDTKDFLADLTKEHPYFTAAQFYLLQQSEPESQDYNNQAAKTAILFNNPFWLNFQLDHSVASPAQPDHIAENDVVDGNATYNKEIEQLEEIHPAADKATIFFDDQQQVDTTIAVDNETAVINNTDPGPAEELPGNLPEAIAVPEEKIPEAENKDEDHIIEDKGITTENEQQSEPANSFSAGETETVSMPAHTIIEQENEADETIAQNEKTAESTEVLSPNLEEAVAITEEKIPEAENKDEDHIIEDNVIITENEQQPEPADAFSAGETATVSMPEHTIIEQENEADKTIAQNEKAAESTEVLSPNLEEAFEAVAVTEEKVTVEENKDDNYDYEGDDMAEEKEIEPMNIKLDFTTATSTTEDTITFEPLHRSDYFASVGIKLSDEVRPGDKLGKQLKSFTEWLKTMKKIHQENLPQQNGQSDIIIQKMAERSNAESEVLTEAMAEVLLQQGKARKAIEVYEKLSLLDPSKSAYFAAKIDQIEI